MKKVDYIIISIALAIITLAWCFYLIDNTILAITVAILLHCIEHLLLKKLSKRWDTPSSNKLYTYLALMGSDYTTSLVSSIISPQLNPAICDGAIFIDNDNVTEMVYCSVKFGQSGSEDIAKAIRLAIKKDVAKVYFISPNVDRRALSIVNSSYVKFEFINGKSLYKAIEKANAMPEINYKKNAVKPITMLAGNALNKRNGIRFIIVSSIMVAMSYITPLRVYYLIVASITFILSLLCYISPKSNNKKNSIFF